MSKAWMVVSGEYEDRVIHLVCLDYQRAQDFTQKFNADGAGYWVTEWHHRAEVEEVQFLSEGEEMPETNPKTRQDQ